MASMTSARICSYCPFRSRSATSSLSLVTVAISCPPGFAHRTARLAIAAAARYAFRCLNVLHRDPQVELDPAMAHPSAEARGVPVHQPVVRNITGHHGAGPDETVLPERH